MARMVLDGAFCPWCILAAIGSFILITILLRSRTGRIAAMSAGFLALAAVLAVTAARPAPGPLSGPVRLIIYEQADCGYCRELRNDVLPPILHRYGGLISVQYRDALDVDWVRRTPTIFIDDPHHPEAIEGLPSVRYLRNRIELRLPQKEARK
jgi:protein-disulfide isomerase